jgi:hypothetical protein
MRRALLAAFALCALGLFLGGSSDPETGLSSDLPKSSGLGNDLASSMGGAYSASVETLSIVLVMDKTITTGHYAAEYAADVAAADAVYELGTDLDFAHVFLRESDEDGAFSFAEYRMGFGDESQPWLWGSTGQYASLLRPDFADLPDLFDDGRQTALSAVMKAVVHSSSLYNAAADTYSVSLITDPGADQWYDPTNLLVNSPSFSYYAATSWQYQKRRNGVPTSIDPRFPAGTSTDPWPFPGADFGNWIWDIATIHDFSNAPPDSCIKAGERWNGCASSETYKKGNIIRFPFKNCLQGVLNGEPYHGLVIGGQSWQGVSPRAWSIYNWEQDKNLSPWIVIKVASKPYASRFGGNADGVVLFNTDDQRDLANLAYKSTLDGIGGKMTVYVREDVVGGGDQLTWAELKTFVDDGHEVGSHSRVHAIPPGFPLATAPWSGLNYWFASDEVTITDWFSGAEYGVDLDTTTTTTQWDMLLWDSDPDWVYDGLESAGASRPALLASNNVAKTLATPSNNWSPAVLRAVKYHGYRALRIGDAGNNAIDDVTNRDPDLLYRNEHISECQRGDADTPLVVAECDTALLGFSETDPTRPVNLVLAPLTASSSVIFGGNGDSPTEFAVRRNTRRLLMKSNAVGRGVVQIYTHDFKSPNPAGYLNGIDADEFEWFVTTADSMGWQFRTVADYANGARGKADAVETPSGWGNVPKWTEADRVFFKPWRDHYRK